MQPIIYLWRKAPCIRLLIPLISGIWLEWQFRFSPGFICSCILCCFISILLYSLLPVENKFRWAVINGITIHLMLTACGWLLVYLQDIRNHPSWIGKNFKDEAFVIVTLEEPLVEKQNSWKTLASVDGIYANNTFQKTRGSILLYLKKDSMIHKLHYGSRLICLKAPRLITNAGNPGGFDFNRYCLFNGITHQVYLKASDYIILVGEKHSELKNFIFNSRSGLVSLLRRFIKGRKEQGLAEALLIGYKDDLDRSLVQSYSNTGVIHIIAISGLHLGLIYALLLVLTNPIKRSGILRLLLILSSLWLFSLLAGGQPSVLRSAVMFSFIATGDVLKRKTYIFNTLALSAFVLLCINPFWLWDVGFQLSYSAVLSIVMFFRPVYNWFYFPNRMLDFVWKMMAVTLSAQLLTLPASIYHFHQLPTLFLLSNIVAVPLSSIILIGEILLCIVFFLDPLAKTLGIVLEHLITIMNSYVERLSTIPFAVWNGLWISQAQAFLLLLIILGFCYWLMETKKYFLWMSLFATILFMCLRSLSFCQAMKQKWIVIYNIPRQRVIELIDGRSARYYGDSAVWYDANQNGFYLKPTHMLYRLNETELAGTPPEELVFQNKRLLLPGKRKHVIPSSPPVPVDLLIVSSHTDLILKKLIHYFAIRYVVVDGSVPAWKVPLWKSQCDSLGISCHIISENGAFVMKL